MASVCEDGQLSTCAVWLNLQRWLFLRLGGCESGLYQSLHDDNLH